MGFQKNNKLGFTSDEPLDKEPICFKGRKGQKEKLKNIPDWQEKLREFVDMLTEQKPS
jgi:hypothetical protein